MLKPLRDFVAFDLETTGLERDADEIIEIGAVRVRDGQLAERMSCLLKAEKPLSSLVESLTGISAAMLAESGQDLKVGLDAFLVFIGDLPLVAHNSDFDIAFIGNALVKHSLPPLPNPVFDSLLLARTAWPNMDSHRLENLVEKLEIPSQKAHRALPDAEQAALLWLKGQEKLATYSQKTLALLQKVLAAGPKQWHSLFTPNLDSEIEVESKLGDETLALPIDPATVTTTISSISVENLFMADKEVAKAFAAIKRPYAARPKQARMAALVERSFKESRLLAVEAEPGTGRILACMISAVRHSLTRRRPTYLAINGRQRMEAVVASELPILKGLFGEGLRVSILKPPSAYLSPRKYSAIIAHPETRLRDEEKLAILPLITGLETTVDGDIGDNMGFNHERNRLLWSKLASESYLSEPGGHAHAAREQAMNAHLVLISQDLFFDDMAVDFALLPPYDSIIFDEAHYLPELGLEKLGRDVSFFRLKYILQLIAYSKTEPAGLLAELMRLAAEATPDAVALEMNSLEAKTLDVETLEALEKLKEKVFEPERQLQKFFNKIAKHAQKKRKDGESRIRYSDKLVIEFGNGPEAFLSATEELEALLIKLSNSFPELAVDLRKVADLLRAFRSDLDHLSHPKFPATPDGDSEGHTQEVFWIEDFPNPHRALIRCAPMDIGPLLAEKFLPQMDAVVFASSALALGDQFGFFTAQVGLDLHADRLKTAMVRTKDKEEKALPIFIARFSPVMNNAAAAQTLGGLILRGLQKIVKPAFVYFTHIGMLKQVRGLIQEGLATEGRMVLAQHVDGSRDNLLHLFRHRKNTCLLGTDAFTANLEIDGPIPEVIIITKLPFPVPTEPITAAHLEKIQAAKQNPLYDYILPNSILRLKQELNRMPRRSGQSQIVWLLDPRPYTEKYGKLYMRGLGRDAIICDSEEDLIANTLQALAPKSENPEV
jgi:DNA polymerase III epsilon subunit family exonuclease